MPIKGGVRRTEGWFRFVLLSDFSCAGDYMFQRKMESKA